MIPVLETERLLMRALEPDDFEAEAAYFATEESRIVGGPMTRDDAWRAFAAYAGHWLLRGYGFWALQLKTGGGYGGRVGLWYPEGWPEPEIGWTLMPAHRGNGYATEAAVAARAFAYRTLGWTTAISLINVANAASQAVARRLGAHPDGDFRHPRFGEMQIWRHLAPRDCAA